jgi:5-methylcytosine-specific restriction endonuclease McrA
VPRTLYSLRRFVIESRHAKKQAGRIQMNDEPKSVARSRPHCYICGATQNLTDDHIPPKALFPPESRENLTTAPLCCGCHSPFTKMDEQMRLWISAGAYATSENANWIWKNKVVNKTFKRSPKLRKYIAKKHLRKMSVETPSGPVVADVITMPQSQVHPFIRRLTKGFLYSFYPDHDYFADNFNVFYQPDVSVAVELATKLSSCSFGKDVCRIWHGLTKDNTKSGVWIFLFYGAACFVCFHGDSNLIPSQPTDEGYREDSNLPPKL